MGDVTLDIQIKGIEGYKKWLNFLSQGHNWDDILEEILVSYEDDILQMARENLNHETRMTKRTGGLERSLRVSVDDSNTISIWSTHEAAGAVEYGHTFDHLSISSGEESPSNIPEYLERYSDKSLPKGKRMTAYSLARAIEDNQPFRDPQPFARPALYYYYEDIKADIVPTAREFQSQGL